MHGKLLEFGCIHTNKNIFLYFWNKEIFGYLDFFFEILEKTGVFNIVLISYNVNLQPDIK
jgi:hypothetical protein